MRIGLVCPYNVIAGGGVQECVFALAKELTARGHYARIVSPRPRGFKGKAPEHVVFVGSATKVSSFHTTAQISASAESTAIDSMLEKHNFDILHFHEPWVPFVSRQILRKSTTCNIATFHAKLPENRMNRTIEKVITPYTSSILKYFDSLTAVSDAAADYVQTLTDDPIQIIPNGIDLDKFKSQPSATKPAGKSIVFVGRLERRKGVAYLLEAFKLLQVQYDNQLTLHLAGAGPDERRLKRYSQELELANVIFHGYVSEEDKIQLMREATVFCSPAPYGESFGIVLLEAISLGTPLVAADNPGYASVMKERGSTSIVNPKNAQALAYRLDAFINDAELRKLWQDWASSYVKQFSYKAVTDLYEKLYKDVCK